MMDWVGSLGYMFGCYLLRVISDDFFCLMVWYEDYDLKGVDMFWEYDSRLRGKMWGVRKSWKLWVWVLVEICGYYYFYFYYFNIMKFSSICIIGNIFCV